MSIDKLLALLADGSDGIESGEFIVSVRKMPRLPAIYSVVARGGGDNCLSIVISSETTASYMDKGQQQPETLQTVAGDIARRMWPKLKTWE